MKRLCLLILFLIAPSTVIAGDPAVLGNHPLTQVQAGQLLIAEFRCRACHTGIKRDSVREKLAPDLRDVGSRITPEYLQSFLASPLVAHPGTTMPDMLASKPESERQAISEALTHFLIAQSSSALAAETSESTKSLESVDRQRGKALFHSVGCVACHGPREKVFGLHERSASNAEEDDDEDDPIRAARKAIQPNAIPLGHVAFKYTVHSLSDFLFQPLKVRPSGRMPDMKLTPAESLDIASYLVENPAQKGIALAPRAELVEAGKEHFQTMNCVACHALVSSPPANTSTAPNVGLLKTADLTGECLSNSQSARSNANRPRFNLDDRQMAAIVAAIQETATADSDSVAVAKTMTVFRCIACHVRDDYGGVHDSHNPHFKGSELNLGEEGRIPPPLTLMGAKLRPEWMKKVLFDGESVRSYMATRMPQYSSANLQHLPDLVRRLDVLDGPPMKIPKPKNTNESDREEERLIREAGRELLGDKGANCVVCHQFNGKAAKVNQGIDLLTSYERLQPEWFYRYLINPQAFCPRTVMPTAWSDGVAAFNTILDGNTHRQIEAIWYYLSLGTSAADPPGVQVINTKLEVGNHAVIHRGRSRVAGYRGIAVGLPEKISYAFNAETGTLSAIWQGDFVGVNWSGQGAGDFNPTGEPIELARDVSFAALPNESEPWPLMPAMSKEAPVNPNPLYPKNVGYQFKGYCLDERSIPTFQYRSGNIEIEDRCVAVIDHEQPALKRLLQFDSPNFQSLWFRALVGEICQESERTYRSGRLRITIPETAVKLRPLPDRPQSSELLLHLAIPQGKLSWEVWYEPLNN